MMKPFLAGLTAAVPIATGYFPVAITFGLLVVNAGLYVLDAVIASALIFAGAAQFMAIGMYASSAAAGTTIAAGPGFQIVFTGWLLNMRHLLMSSVIAHNLDGHPRRPVRSVLAFGITDEVFGVAGVRIAQGGTMHPAFLVGLELGAYAAWVGGSAVGATVGEVLPAGLRSAMGLALYALFAALLAGQIRAGRTLAVSVAALVGAGINTAVRVGLHAGPGTAFFPAMVGGAIAGWIVITVSERSSNT